jgi:2-haloacid dehalogenase
MNVSISDIMMIAAHGWDMAGASNAGMRTAFIERPGKVLYPLAPAPELTVPNLLKLAEQLSEIR